jgi:hypothetical protein
MKSITYQGFGRQDNVCHYLVISKDVLPGGMPGVLFVPTPSSTTTITNCIEDIVSSLLKTELLGTMPKSLRFFEHYPKFLNPMAEWQEVTFAQIDGCFLKQDLWTTTKRSWFNTNPDYWAVEKPHWHPVGQTLANQLQTLIY